jgi:hypothetical protein
MFDARDSPSPNSGGRHGVPRFVIPFFAILSARVLRSQRRESCSSSSLIYGIQLLLHGLALNSSHFCPKLQK